MSDNFENDGWEAEGSGQAQDLFAKYKVPAIGIAAALTIAFGSLSLSGGGDYESMRVSYLKGEYDDVISTADDLLEAVDAYTGAEVNLLLSKVYSDKSGDYYDLDLALSSLEQSFAVQPTKALANTAILYINELGYPEKRKLKYLEHLAKSKDSTAARELIIIYSSQPSLKERAKAKKYVGHLADTLENKVLLARLYLDKSSGMFNQSSAMRLLASAANSGSPEALFLMAKQNLIIAKYSPKVASKLLGEYPSLVARAVRLGYRGDGVDEAIETIKFGRDGVLRNASLAKELRRLIDGVE